MNLPIWQLYQKPYHTDLGWSIKYMYCMYYGGKAIISWLYVMLQFNIKLDRGLSFFQKQSHIQGLSVLIGQSLVHRDLEAGGFSAQN